MRFDIQALIPQIRIGNDYLDAEQAEHAGLILSQHEENNENGVFLRLSLVNRSGKAIRLEKFNWHYSGDKSDFLRSAGINAYLEGWQMATPGGVRRPDDRDYRFDPDYLKYAVAEPEDHSSEPGHFRAENVVMFHDRTGGETLLFGFVTSADQFGHFKFELDGRGVKELDIRSACDGMLLENGETVHSEALAVMTGTDGYSLLRRFAGVWAEKMRARTGFKPPVGWCSWYYYFEKVREEDILENAEFIAAHKDDYPLRYIQLDDGYQSAAGDWLVCNEKFPHGLGDLAARLREKGFTPALWVAPFVVEDGSALLKEHPEWMIRDAAGKIVMEFQWRKHPAAILDGTHPGVRRHFRELFAKIRAMGFDYVKLDFMVMACAMRRGVLHDPKATRAQALRRGLAAIREGFGDDGYILGCTVPFGPTVGLVDGMRISTDITPYWAPAKWFDEAPTVPNVCRNVIRRTYMNKLLWNNDPDTLIVRDDNTKLTENEVRLWYQAVRLSGGMLMLSDRFSTLKPERAAMPIELLKEPDAYETRPGDFWSDGIPKVWSAEHRVTGVRENGLFNFAESAEEICGIEVSPHSCIITK